MLKRPMADPQRFAETASALLIRKPDDADGPAVHALIGRCPPLDANSLYCNLLQCAHFAETSALAERGRRLCGFVSGFIVPGRPRHLFIWQVAVAPEARGRALGQRMMRAILARPALAAVRELHTTVTPDNAASAAMFEALARELGAPLSRRVLFECQRHFGGRHASEVLFEIGPFASGGAAAPRPRSHQPHPQAPTSTGGNSA